MVTWKSFARLAHFKWNDPHGYLVIQLKLQKYK